MKKALYKVFSFHWTDLVGVIVGLFFLFSKTDFAMYELVTSYFLYLFTFLIIFVTRMMIWVFLYHGESSYLAEVIGQIFKDFLRIILMILSILGIYFFYRWFS